MSGRDLLVWIDIETGGLDPARDPILEIGVAISGPDLVPYDALHLYVSHSPDTLRMSAAAWVMHRYNGLLRELGARFGERVLVATEWIEALDTKGRVLETGSMVPNDAADEVAAWLHQRGAHGARLAGSSVHFDRSFFAPSGALNILSHRNFDVSVFADSLRWWRGDVALPPKRETHRVMDDIAQSIGLARVARLVLTSGSA